MNLTTKALTFFIGMAIAASMLGACSKETLQPISSDLVKNFSYKVGTYWIMRDSIGGRVDSFFVTSNTFYSQNGNNENTIGIGISEYNNGTINPDSLSWSIGLVESDFYLNIESPDTSFFYVTNAAPLSGYPFGTYPPQEYVVPSLTVNGNTYSNIAEISHDYGPSADDEFYINNDNGFVEIRLSHPGANIIYVWELERENIVR